MRGGPCGVVDPSEDGDALLFEDRLQAIDGLRNAVGAGLDGQTFTRLRGCKGGNKGEYGEENDAHGGLPVFERYLNAEPARDLAESHSDRENVTGPEGTSIVRHQKPGRRTRTQIDMWSLTECSKFLANALNAVLSFLSCLKV